MDDAPRPGAWTRAPLERFGDRAGDYARHRPGYPPGVIRLLERELGLAPGAVVADLGAGTGIFSALLLEADATVRAVEPNAAMRAALVEALGGHPRFEAVAGRAEATGLPDASCDLVVAAQAFHWFDPPATRAEALRILRPGGGAALVWNARRVEGTPLAEAYEALLRAWGTDYGRIPRRAVPADVTAFFGHDAWLRARLDNHQLLDEGGFLGRLTSSSYVPGEGHPNRAPMLDAARALFREHAEGGVVRVDYDVDVILGRPQAA